MHNTDEFTSNAVMCDGSSSVSEILDLLRKHGERLDSEIAEEMDIPLETVRQAAKKSATKLRERSRRKG